MTKLTDNLSLLAGAPNGIKKLRELILELAVRGKLVRQDPNDEPADEFLKRIAEEKARLMAGGMLKKQKPLAKVSNEEVFFDIPKTWAWARFGEICAIKGELVKPEDFPDFRQVAPDCIEKGTGRLIESRTVKDAGIKGPNSRFFAGQIVYSKIRPSLSKAVLVDFDGLCSADMYPLDAFIDSRFLLKQILSETFLEQVRVAENRIKMPKLNQESLTGFILPIPPFAEQRRIVAKVDELMALCDHLEAQQTDAESSHARLVQALLNSLTQTSDATDFATSWQRLAEHFHTLFTTESSIDSLKQALLQLAVMGKLVPQNLSDEPASELLKRIEIEKQRLVATGGLKKLKQLSEKPNEELLGQRPSNWTWTSFDAVANTRLGKMLDKAKNKGVPRQYLRNTNVQWSKFKLDDLKKMRFEDRELDEYQVLAGDLVICEGGEPGRCAVWQGQVDEMFIQKALHRARPWLGISPYYLFYCLRVAAHSGFLEQYFTGATIKHFSGEKLAKFPIPLPPVQEQHRIVAKVDQLMALCAQLKDRLVQARHVNEQLSGTLVEHALTKGNKPVNEPINREKAQTLLAAEIVQQLHCEKRMGRVKLQKVISLAEHVARLKEIQSKEERYAAGPHDPALMTQAVQGLRENQWFEELALDDGKRYEYRPLAQSGAHRPAYEALWSAEQRQQINELIELMRPWDTAKCERVATLYSAWNDLLIEGREAHEAAILQEVLHGWNESKLKYSEAQWRTELAEMHQHSFLIPTGFGKRTSGGKLTLPGFEPSI